MVLFFSGDVGTRKIRFINVSSSSADRRWELVPITPDRDPSSAGAIHDNSSALINYFFLPPTSCSTPPFFFSSFFFVRIRVPKPHARHGCLPSPHPAGIAPREWFSVDERRIGCYHLSSAIVADRHRQQNRDAFFSFFFYFRPGFVGRDTEY